MRKNKNSLFFLLPFVLTKSIELVLSQCILIIVFVRKCKYCILLNLHSVSSTKKKMLHPTTLEKCKNE